MKDFLDCFPTKLTLQSKFSSTSLIVYQFNEEISITSDVQISCAQSFSTRYQWIIYKCTSNCSICHDLDDKTARASDEIYIPPNTLNFGVYQLTLTVIITTKSSQFNSSASILIEIARPVNVFVHLIEYRMSEITLGQTDDLLLEPRRYSHYTDGNTLILDVSQREEPSTDFHFFLFF